MVWKASIGDDVFGFGPKKIRGGIIVEVIKGKGVNVKVNDTQSIWLEIISDENDLECWADEWAIENKLEVGEVLE